MNNDLWLLPEGIEEVLPPDAEQLEVLRRRLIDCYHSWGYELVMPPMIEYLESLLTGTGHEMDLQTFKLTDQQTGRTMGFRADMTPQVARIDAHQLGRDVPTRLCYFGTVLHTRPDGFAGSRSPLQIGVELYGHSGIDSEVEVVQVMLETLALAGVNGAHLDLGHVGIFRSLARQAGLSEAQESELFDLLQRKAQAELDAFFEAVELKQEYAAMLAALPTLNGGAEVLPRAREVLAAGSAGVASALGELEVMVSRIRAIDPQLPVFLDMAELRGYHYHTGVVFAVFLPGQGAEIARGGRYDEIGKVFGKARPATGFSTDLKTLVALGHHSENELPPVVYAPAGDDAALQKAIAELRADGVRVVQELPGQNGGAVEMGCQEQLVLSDGEWGVQTI